MQKGLPQHSFIKGGGVHLDTNRDATTEIHGPMIGWRELKSLLFLLVWFYEFGRFR